MLRSPWARGASLQTCKHRQRACSAPPGAVLVTGAQFLQPTKQWRCGSPAEDTEEFPQLPTLKRGAHELEGKELESSNLGTIEIRLLQSAEEPFLRVAHPNDWLPNLKEVQGLDSAPISSRETLPKRVDLIE